MRARAELVYAAVGLTGLVLLALAVMLRHESLSFTGAVVYALAALVLVSWTGMGIGTSRRRAREEAERNQREAQEQLRKDAQDAARRAAQMVNAQRTTSLGGTTITVHRRSSSDVASGRQ